MVDPVNASRLTGLGAVNIILNAYGEANVTRTDQTANAIKATNHLERTLTQVAAERDWDSHLTKMVTLTKGTNNKIVISDDIIEIIPLGQDRNVRVAIKNGLLFNRDDQTFLWDHSVQADVTRLLGFEDLTQQAAYYVAHRAALAFLNAEKPDDPSIRNVERATQNALISLEQADYRQRPGTLVDKSPHFNRMRSRRRRSV